jgi:hypothetical protein
MTIVFGEFDVESAVLGGYGIGVVPLLDVNYVPAEKTMKNLPPNPASHRTKCQQLGSTGRLRHRMCDRLR